MLLLALSLTAATAYGQAGDIFRRTDPRIRAMEQKDASGRRPAKKIEATEDPNDRPTVRFSISVVDDADTLLMLPPTASRAAPMPVRAFRLGVSWAF